MQILLAQGNIQTVGVPGRLQIGRRRSLAQHLLDGVARHQMNQQEHQRDHQPDHRQRVQQTKREVAQHIRT